MSKYCVHCSGRMPIMLRSSNCVLAGKSEAELAKEIFNLGDMLFWNELYFFKGLLTSFCGDLLLETDIPSIQQIFKLYFE